MTYLVSDLKFECILVIMQKIIIDLIDCVLLEILFKHMSVIELHTSESVTRDIEIQ